MPPLATLPNGHETSQPRPRALVIASLCALALIAFYIWSLAALYGRDGGWMIDQSGHPRTNEFSSVRAAGELALSGKAAGAYDWALHEAATAAVIGRPVTHYFQYPYPPTYFVIAAGLALLPYFAGTLFWIVATAALYAWSVARIAGARVAGLWALATPATAFNAFVAHTGFWTAGVSGLAIASIPKRPWLAGILFGVLTLKPQLGLLVPVALIAGSHWRVMAAAAVSATALVIVSLVGFGFEPWLQFPSQMARVSEAARFDYTRTGQLNFNLLVTVYGFLRAIGVSDIPALIAQACAGICSAVTVFLLWRSDAPFALKGAGLAALTFFATPYLFVYDLTHLGVAAAFLIAHAGLSGLQRLEVIAIVAMVPLILGVAFIPLPLAFLSTVLMAIVVMLRIWPLIAHEACVLMHKLPWAPQSLRA